MLLIPMQIKTSFYAAHLQSPATILWHPWPWKQDTFLESHSWSQSHPSIPFNIELPLETCSSLIVQRSHLQSHDPNSGCSEEYSFSVYPASKNYSGERWTLNFPGLSANAPSSDCYQPFPLWTYVFKPAKSVTPSADIDFRLQEVFRISHRLQVM